MMQTEQSQHSRGSSPNETGDNGVRNTPLEADLFRQTDRPSPAWVAGVTHRVDREVAGVTGRSGDAAAGATRFAIVPPWQVSLRKVVHLDNGVMSTLLRQS